MYVFAGVMLLGLAVCKLVDLISGFALLSRISKTLVAMLLGIATAWAADYDVFAGFGTTFRDQWYGVVGTGLALAGIAHFWHEALDLVASYTRRVHDQATEIETRLPRAA
jgi:hypothetical protein